VRREAVEALERRPVLIFDPAGSSQIAFIRFVEPVKHLR